MNKVAFITGASRGIGKATALAFARAGYDLIISARTLEDGERHSHGLRRADAGLPQQAGGDGARAAQAALAVQEDPSPLPQGDDELGPHLRPALLERLPRRLPIGDRQVAPRHAKAQGLARQRLDLGVGTLANRDGALIFSAGDLALGGGLDAGQPAAHQHDRARCELAHLAPPGC